MLKDLLRAKPQTRAASLPEGMRVHAVGDVHGRADLLENVLAEIDADIAAHRNLQSVQVFLGDYIDRGPSSREVLDLLIAFGATHRCLFLKGNHEALLLDFLENPAVLAQWRQNGALPTLVSYGLAPSLNPKLNEQHELSRALNEALPASHRQFLRNLKLSYTCGDMLFVHAGIRPGVPLSQQREQDMLWIRDEFLSYTGAFEKRVVHGHTPVTAPDVHFNRINIDTGAYATGRLTCAIFQDDNVRFL